MSLPIVMIFERHWDPIPKLLVKDLLPRLVRQGYDTVCFEFPQNWTTAEIFKHHNEGLELDAEMQRASEIYLGNIGISAQITKKLSDASFMELAGLLQLAVSSKKYLEMAERIKQFPASRILKDVFDEAVRLHISVKGIDIDSEDFLKVVAPDISARQQGLNASEDYRIATIFGNLLKLRTQQEGGVIFVCGAIHANNLASKFREHDMQDDFLYYFPHSSKRYQSRIDDITFISRECDSLLGHTHLLAKQEISRFGERIALEVTAKTRYKKEILDGNSHCQFLSSYFGVHFRAFVRPGNYVDALADFDDLPNAERIRERLGAVQIPIHDVSLNGQKYLVIPGVNAIPSCISCLSR